MLTRSLPTIASAVLLGILAGCNQGSDEKIAAEAGDIRITLPELQDAYEAITPANRPDISTPEARRSFANDLLNKEIVLAEAHRMGVDPGIEATADQAERQKTLETLYRIEVSDKVEVRGEDLQKVYDRRAFNVKGSHILVEDPAEADGILEEIRSGKIPFGKAAEKYSRDNATRANGGRMNELAWSMALPDFQLELFDMEPGEMKTFDGSIGGHVLRLDERIPQEQASLEESRQALRTDVRNQLEAVRMREYLAELEEKAGLTWHDEGLDLCGELMRKSAAVDTATVEPQERYIPVATDEEKAVPIATFSGRDWTVGDYIEGIRNTPVQQRPPGTLPKRALRELIRGTQLRDELLHADALAKGLDKNPAIQTARARQIDQLLVDQVVYGFLKAADIPDERVRAFYDSSLAASPDVFLVPEQVDLMLLIHTDSTVVAQGLARIRAGEDESAVIKELSVDFRSAIRGGRTGPIVRGTYAPELDEASFAAKPGDGWSAPIVTPTGTGAFRVIEHLDAHTATFDELKDRIRTTLARKEGEEAFESWLAAERDRRGVEMHDDVLAMIGGSGP